MISGGRTDGAPASSQKEADTNLCQHTAAARPGLEELGLSMLFCL